ncbi:uncharacterized protein ZSWIM9-like isoform X1 [Pleurodeles waltl]|uniref:uncharacterized protein ZSWIM9-like isoform X1 n=1 Tax=Pleurodeles waltl TaxID=8319 RepID=UPI0037097A6E
MDTLNPLSPAMEEKEEPPAAALPLDLSLPPGSASLEERELRGREFPSWEAFCSYLESWCEQKATIFIIREFIPLSRCEWAADLMSPEAVAALKYSYLRLACKGRRRSRKLDPGTEKKICPSSIAVRLNQRKDRLVIVDCKFVHNHVLCPNKFKRQFKKGQLLAHNSLSLSKLSVAIRKPGKPGRPSKAELQAMYYLSQPLQDSPMPVHLSPQPVHHSPQPVHLSSQSMQNSPNPIYHSPKSVQQPSQAIDEPSGQAVHHHSRVMRRTTQAVRLSTQGLMRQSSKALRKPSLTIRNPSLAVRHASQAVRRNARVVRRNSRPGRSTKKGAKQFLGDHDIRRLLASCKARDRDLQDTLKALDGLFAGDPASKVKVIFVKNNATIQTVFIQTSLMRSLCQRFPETLIFDRMMGFNEEFALFTLLCVDSNNRGRECAFCLARKGTPDLLRFTLLSLIQSIPEVKSTVKCVSVGVRVTEPGVVHEFLPGARVHLCRLEVLGALLNKIQEIGSAQDEKSWPLLCDLASSSSPEAYAQTMEKMQVSFSRELMRYFQEYWHPCRKMWVPCWGPETQQGTNTLIREHQQKLVSGLSPSPTLGQCILDLVAMQAPMVDLENLNGEEVAACYRSVCNPEPARLIERELGVVCQGSYSIQGTEEGYTLGDGTSKYLLDHKLTSCSCLFHTSSLLPCRHLFVTRFRTGDALFDVSLLQKNKSSLIKTFQK